MTELTLTGARLGGQDMARERMMTNHLAGTCFLEPFRRTLMCLQLGHFIVLGVPGRT